MKKIIIGSLILMGAMIWIFPLSAQAADAEKERPNKISIGLGVPYGILGGNLEIEKNHLAISGGLGYDLAGLDWAVGARAYLNEPDEAFRLRASCFYGVVALAEKKKDAYSESTYEDYSGLAPSLGFEWRFGKNVSLEFDLLYAIFDEEEIKTELKREGYTMTEDFGSPIRISFGLAKRW
ncbi:MAG: hypothetical protein V2A53_09390 [bacterium]